MRTSQEQGAGPWQVVPLDAMDGDSIDAWIRMRSSAAAFRSPFFHPRFAAAVGGVGRPVWVALRRDAREITAVWPFELENGRMRPVGWPAADFQGPITGATVDPMEVMRTVGAHTLSFDHLVEDVLPTQTVRAWRTSPYLDVDGGMDGYRGRISKSARDRLARARAKARTASAELGPLRFTSRSTSVDLLAEVVRLKRRQYAETGVGDFLADPAHRRLLRHLLRCDDDHFGGVLSAVHCGDTLLAAHFGLRDSGVLHWWFPVYDPTFARFAPGWLLMNELISAAPELGFDRIDLGRGEDEFKRRLKTGDVRVGTGVVSNSRPRRILTAADALAYDWVRRTGVAPHVRRSVRRARRVFGVFSRG